MLSKSQIHQFRIRVLAYLKANPDSTAKVLRANLHLGLFEFGRLLSTLIASRTVLKTRTKPVPVYRIHPHVESLSIVEQIARIEELTRLGMEMREKLQATVVGTGASSRMLAIKAGATAEEEALLGKVIALLGDSPDDSKKPVTLNGIVVKPGERMMVVGRRAGKVVTRDQLAAIGFTFVPRNDTTKVTTLANGVPHLPLENGFLLAPLMDEAGALTSHSLLYREDRPDEGILISESILSLLAQAAEDEREKARAAVKAERVARVLDPETGAITEIPLVELAPDYVLGEMEGFEGDVYLHRSQIPKGDYRHPPFDEKRRASCESFSKVFRDVKPMTAEEWEDGFRRDKEPDEEIQRWQWIARAFTYLVNGGDVSPAVKMDYFRIIYAAKNVGTGRALQLVQLEALTQKEARAAVEELERADLPRA